MKISTSKKCIILGLLFSSILFAGCSFRPQKMSEDKVEKIVKEAINPGVYLSEKEPKTEELYDGKHYTYSFMDERGIPFTVTMTSPYFSLIDFKKGIYEDFVVFHTDYRKSVMNYYQEQVEDIFDSVDGISFDEKDNEIIIITDIADLELLEDVLRKMDALYDFEYEYSDELRVELDKNVYWEDFRSYDLLIRYNGKQEDIFFTVRDDDELSADDIHRILDNLKKKS